MQTYELIAPCHFGLEAVLKRELAGLGCAVTRVEDGRVTCTGDAAAAARANIFLRTPERVLLCVGRFRAETFDELFDDDSLELTELREGLAGAGVSFELIGFDTGCYTNDDIGKKEVRLNLGYFFHKEPRRW